MSEVINLRQARKRAARAAREAEAAANRAKYGLSKEKRSLAQAEEQRQAKTLDGARRDDFDK